MAIEDNLTLLKLYSIALGLVLAFILKMLKQYMI